MAKKVKFCKEKVTSDDGVTSLDACPAPATCEVHARGAPRKYPVPV